MKGTIIAIMSIMLLNSAAAAQETAKAKPDTSGKRPQFEYFAGGGLVIPHKTSYLAEYYDGLYNVTAGIGYKKWDRNTVILEAAYNEFGLDSKKYMNSFNLEGSAKNGNISIYSLIFGLKRRISKQSGDFQSYIKINFWELHQRFEEIEITFAIEDTIINEVGDEEMVKRDSTYVLPKTWTSSLTAQFSVGAEYRFFGNWYVYGEAKYCMGFATGEIINYIPINIGILYRRK